MRPSRSSRKRCTARAPAVSRPSPGKTADRRPWTPGSRPLGSTSAAGQGKAQPGGRLGRWPASSRLSARGRVEAMLCDPQSPTVALGVRWLPRSPARRDWWGPTPPTLSPGPRRSLVMNHMYESSGPHSASAADRAPPDITQEPIDPASTRPPRGANADGPADLRRSQEYGWPLPGSGWRRPSSRDRSGRTARRLQPPWPPPQRPPPR
jgi:hypothetical protein